MAPVSKETDAYISTIVVPPPPGSPYAVPVPGTEREGRTPIYRHWRFRDTPLLDTYDPNCQTLHDIFENSWTTRPSKRFLGWRPWNAATKTWENKYVWMTYAEAAERRKNLGAGVVELHHRIGITGDNYGVGLWAQNRPEWQITGPPTYPAMRQPRTDMLTKYRTCSCFPIIISSIAIRDSWTGDLGVHYQSCRIVHGYLLIAAHPNIAETGPSRPGSEDHYIIGPLGRWRNGWPLQVGTSEQDGR